MAEVGVVLKVPQDTHAKLKAACNKHDRSMQKVLLALIEGWVANGAPDPITYGNPLDVGCDERGAVDIEARQGLKLLTKDLNSLTDRFKVLETELARASVIFDSMRSLRGFGEEAQDDKAKTS